MDLTDYIDSFVEENYGEVSISDTAYHFFILGKKHAEEQMMANLWKPADGDDLPEIDREVLVLVQDYPDDKDHLRVAFAHRPSKYAKFWNSTLGEEQIVEIEGYGKGGWNIPNVKYWLDCSLPNVED